MKGVIGWFAENTVAANLLMIGIVVGGLISYFSLNREFFPSAATDSVVVSVPYLGAGPEEVEDRILIRIEEAISDLDGIKKVTSRAREGVGTVTVEVQNGYNARELLNDIKAKVDGINTFPLEAERPIVTENEQRVRTLLMAVYGDVDAKTLKRVSEKIRDELVALREVDIAELEAVLPYEVSIELSENALRQYGLTFNDVAAAVRGNSLNLPAGTIRSEVGNITLRTRGQAYNRDQFENIVVLQRPDGTVIKVGDVAKVIDGFQDADLIAHFNGHPATLVQTYATIDPDVIATSKAVKAYLDQLRPTLPEGLDVHILDDNADTFKERLDLLIKNGIGGLTLVFIVLLMFLRPAVAFWVAVGIAISFLGAIWMLPWLGVSMNMISLFAFLLVLGIVVDDAIIVGESIHAQNERGVRGNRGAVLGAQMVAKPVFYAVATTIIAFSPMLFVPGSSRDIAQNIPLVVISALCFSLVEAMLILPSHLNHLKPYKASGNGAVARLQAFQHRVADGMMGFAQRYYLPLLKRSLNWRGMTVVVFVIAFGLATATVGGGWLRVSFMPDVVADFIFATVQMPQGAAFSTSERVLKRIEDSARQVGAEMEEEIGFNPVGPMFSVASGNRVRAWATMNIPTGHDNVAELFSARWRKAVGALPEADDIKFSASFNDFNKPIQIQVSDANLKELEGAVEALKTELSSYSGVYDVRDSFSTGSREIVLDLKTQAKSLNLDLANLARQVREGFYGAEAQRIPRGKDDVKVMIRYPKEVRESVDSLANVRVRTAQGAEVPFEAVADAKYVQGFTEIQRVDRKRVAVVSAEVRPNSVAPGEVIGGVFRDKVPELQRRFPGAVFALDGDSVDQKEFTDSLLLNTLIAIAMMYALLAVAFRSYGQPLIILTAIPFGFTGAIIGHLLLGLNLSMFSFLGIVAASGVVVNDNLVLIDRINSLRYEEGWSLKESLIEAARDRFRPIILTSLTTFIGLVPIISETSIQAQFLIPMVAALAFGVLFATGVTLILVPSLYSLGRGLKHHVGDAWRKMTGHPAEV